MNDWTQTRDEDWVHPDGRSVEYDHDCWWAYVLSDKWTAEPGYTAHEAAIACGWYDFPADPYDPDTMLGFMTLCAVLRVWVEGWTQTTDACWLHSDGSVIIRLSSGWHLYADGNRMTSTPSPTAAEAARRAGRLDFPGAAP